MRFALASSIVVMAVSAITVPRHVGQGNGIAIPITKRGAGFMNADKSIDFFALRSHAASVEARIRRGLANYEQNTHSEHPTVSKKRYKRDYGQVGGPEVLNDTNAQLWYGEISVGTPPQEFTVAFSTGFGDFFLPSLTCDSTCEGHNLYDAASSSTAEKLNKAFNITYEDMSSIMGEQWTDTVSLAGFNATSQTIGAADTYASGLQKPVFTPDGVMGLAFPSISNFGADGVFQTLVQQGQVTAVFSFMMSIAGGGELYVGGTNSAHYTGDFTFVPLSAEGFWEVTIDDIQGNSNVILQAIDAIFDTGSNLIIGVADDVASFYSILGGNSASSYGPGYYTFPCDAFPEVDLYFGAYGYGINTKALNLGPVSTGSSNCVSGIVASQDPHAVHWVIGDIFLSGVYTTYDLINSQVGIAYLSGT